MDLIATKLEEFGLEEFIDSYRFYLCNKTVSPLKIAVALTFDADQCAIITHPPDNFSKCEKLYELVQKKSEVKDFLEALDDTGNEHILKFIKETELSAFDYSASTSANPNRKRGIWFNLPEPIESFCGREDFLIQLHDQLKHRDDSETEVTVLSQVKIVSGLGGIGKTETARRYIMKQRKLYNNFIWINAENDNLLTNSFLRLAEEIKIPVKDAQGKSREIEEIVKDIYNKICALGRSNLIVFDNAEDFQSCKRFFPFGLHHELTKPVILATSRNQEWISPTGKRIPVIPLDVLTTDESLEFILKELEIPEEDVPEFTEESKEFVQLIGGLPLALQQAVAYIIQEKEHRNSLGSPYKISDYVHEFKLSMEKLLRFSPVPAPDSSPTVFVTYNMTLLKFFDLIHGEDAIKILGHLSFLYADKIPPTFLHDLVPEIKDAEFSGAIKLLKKYSLIKQNVKDFSLSIHRQLQFVILQYLEDSNEISKMAEGLSEKCSAVLKKLQISNEPEVRDVFLNISQMLNRPFKLSMPKTFWMLIWEFASVLTSAGRYRESCIWYQRLHSLHQKLFGDDHRTTITALTKVAAQLFLVGEYEESLALQEQVLARMKTHQDFGPDHPTTIEVKDNLCIVLKVHKRHEEALELLHEVLSQKVKIHGQVHPSTLQTAIAIADLYAELGHFCKSAAMREELEEKEASLIDGHPQLSLQLKNYKAQELYYQGRFQEAARLYKAVHDVEKATLGEQHPQTVNTLVLLTEASLGDTNNLEEGLKQFKEVYESSKRISGEGHFRSIHIKLRIAYVLTEMGKYEESLEIVQEVFGQLPKIPGPNMELSLLEQCKIAKRYCEQGEFAKGLELVEDAERKQIDILGSSHPHTEGTRNLKHRLMKSQETGFPENP